MRNLIKASLLTLVLTVPAWAGNMGQPIAPPGEMGNPVATTTESARNGEMGCPIAGSEITMNLLQALLALF
jgi:hypothetical protein